MEHKVVMDGCVAAVKRSGYPVRKGSRLLPGGNVGLSQEQAEQRGEHCMWHCT